MLLKLRAKVNLFASEEQMEIQSKYDMGNIANSKEWVWRNIALPVETVSRVIAYNDAKTIVQFYDEDEQVLVWEKFDVVYEKWRAALYEYHNAVDFDPDEEEATEEDLIIGGDDEEED